MMRRYHSVQHSAWYVDGQHRTVNNAFLFHVSVACLICACPYAAEQHKYLLSDQRRTRGNVWIVELASLKGDPTHGVEHSPLRLIHRSWSDSPDMAQAPD